MNLLLKRRCVQSRRLIATSTLCVLAGLIWLAWFRQPTPAKAEHSLPPVIRLDIDSNDNAVVPACQTITDYLNHAAHPNARTSWQSWASGNECEALNDRVAQKDELELYHIYHVLERKDGFVCVRVTGDDVPCYWTAVAMLPWHAAGTLDRRDAERVEQALAEDGELAQRYELVREELAETIRLNESLGAPSARAMEKLFAAIDAEEARATHTRPQHATATPALATASP
jgi:hypothetical protein